MQFMHAHFDPTYEVHVAAPMKNLIGCAWIMVVVSLFAVVAWERFPWCMWLSTSSSCFQDFLAVPFLLLPSFRCSLYVHRVE